MARLDQDPEELTAPEAPRPHADDRDPSHGTSGETVVAGGLWQVASSVAPRLQILVISIVAARVLGPEDMGRQSFISFVALSVVAVATGGLPFALSRYVGRSVGEGRPELVARLYHRTWRLEIVLALAAAGVIVGIGQVRGELPAAWAWAAVWAVGMILHTVPANLLGGLQRWREVSRVTLIVGLATAASVITVLVLGGGITEMFLVPAVVGSVSVVWTKVLADRAAAGLSAHAAPVPEAMRREARGFVAWMSLQVVLTFVVWQRSEFWFLDRYATDEQIAIYSIAFSAVMSLGRIPFALANVAFPAFATLDGAGEVHRLRGAVNRILRVQLLAALPMTAFFVAAGPSLLSLIYGREYDATGSVLQVLMAGFPLLPLGLSGGAVLMGLGRLRSLVAIYAAGAVVNIALDVALVADHAAIGAAWANTIAQSVIGIALAVAVHRIIGGLDVGLPHVLRGALVSGLAMVLGLLAADQFATPLPSLLASASVVGIIAWLGGGLVRAFPTADVVWLANAVSGRLGPRASAAIHRSLAPFH